MIIYVQKEKTLDNTEICKILFDGGEHGGRITMTLSTSDYEKALEVANYLTTIIDMNTHEGCKLIG